MPIAWATNQHWKVSRLIPRIKPGRSCDDLSGVTAGYNLVRLHWGRPSPTIPRTCNGSLYAGLLHPVDHRYCSAPELKRLSSFPDAYVFSGLFQGQWAGIGNSVPPSFMEHIARHVAMTLLDRPVEPAASRPLDFIDKPINPPGPYLFNVVSLFAGCGGSSLGYKWAGGKVLAAVEWDHNAAETYRLNHHGTPVLERDIKTVTPEELLTLTGLQPGELDILDGSPPCQGFSTAGKRNFYDDRNDLFAEYVRLLRGLQPKVFVMENVSGMVKGHMKHIFARIMRELKASGYTVKAQLMNAMYFGVPQSRERVIIIGVREDLRIVPDHPTAQTKAPTLRETLQPVPPVAQQAGASSPLKRARWRETARGDAHDERFALLRLAWDKTPGTLLGVPGSGGHMHPDTPRLLSIGELRRLASFPDAFAFAGRWEDAVSRMGNTVPPRFMQAIAEHVHDHVLAPVLAPGPAGQAPGAR